MRRLDEAREVTERIRRLLRNIGAIIRSELPKADVLRYGSVARGTQDVESDYDILVLSDAPLSRARQGMICSAIFDWELDEGIVESLLFRTQSEWDSAGLRRSPFRREVQWDAVAL